jgi:hypothetical protein
MCFSLHMPVPNVTSHMRYHSIKLTFFETIRRMRMDSVGKTSKVFSEFLRCVRLNVQNRLKGPSVDLDFEQKFNGGKSDTERN